MSENIKSYWKRLAEGLMGNNSSEFNQDDWEAAGDDYREYGRQRRDYFSQQYKIPCHTDRCACGHHIEQNCYVVNKKLGVCEVVGNCCINKFTGENRQKCENCGASHKNRKNNSCKPCRKLWQCKMCKKYLDLFGPFRQNKMCFDCKKDDDEEQKKRDDELKKEALFRAKKAEEEKLRRETEQKKQDDERSRDDEERRKAQELTHANLNSWQCEENKRILSGGDPLTPLPLPNPIYVKCNRCKQMQCKYDKQLCKECHESMLPTCSRCDKPCNKGFLICVGCAYRPNKSRSRRMNQPSWINCVGCGRNCKSGYNDLCYKCNHICKKCRNTGEVILNDGTITDCWDCLNLSGGPRSGSE